MVSMRSVFAINLVHAIILSEFWIVDIHVETTTGHAISIAVVVSVSITIDIVVRIIGSIFYHRAMDDIITDEIFPWLRLVPVAITFDSLGSVELFPFSVQSGQVHLGIDICSVKVLKGAATRLVSYHNFHLIGHFVREGCVPSGVDLGAAVTVDERHLVLADKVQLFCA